MSSGIDISRTGVRICQARSGTGSIAIDGAAYLPYGRPVEDRLEGFLENADQLDLPRNLVQVGVSGKNLNMRYMTCPASDPVQIERMVSMEVEQFAGTHKQEGLEYSYHILGAADENNQYPILIGLLRGNWLERLDGGMKKQGVRLEACVPDSIAYYQAFDEVASYDENNYSTDGLVLLANIGYNTIDSVLLRDGTIVSARNSTGGITTITDQITEESETEESGYRKLWQHVQGEGKFEEEFREDMKGGISALGTRVYSAYNYFQREFSELPDQPDSLYISGEGARIPDVRQELQEHLQVNVQTFDPTSACDLSALPEKEQSLFRSGGPEWSVPLGLALSIDRERGQFLKFTTSGAERREKWWHQEFPALAGMVIVMLAILVFGTRKYMVTQPVVERKKSFEQRLEDLNKREERQKEIQEQLASFRRESQRIRNLQMAGASVLETLKQIPLYQPDEVRFTNLSLDVKENSPPDIILDGFIEKDVRQAIPIMNKFRDKLNKQTEFSVSRQDRPMGGAGKTKFSFRLTYNP